MNGVVTSRRASHAGSWYTNDGKRLSDQLDTWLRQAGESVHGPARAIIAPHAGYSYSGPCAAYAYKEVDPSQVKRVFILGPSHHLRLSNCALSRCKTYETPLYNMEIDQQVYSQLLATGEFDYMDLDADEAEHSIEMHLSYIAKVMEGQNFTIVPVLVGSLNSARETAYGRIFAPYLAQPDNLFVVSSDFCHWGSRFGYQFYRRTWGEIHECINRLDHMGMELIESRNPDDFKSYLREYGNTICGRHPISVLLNAMQELAQQVPQQELKFLRYAQSDACKNVNDSSVSYASASLVIN